MPQILESIQEGRVLHLILNRPERRNALNAALCRQLAIELEEAEGNPEIGAILLSSNGSAFCAGMDVGELGAVSNQEINHAQERLFTVGGRLRKPLIGAVDGVAFGGGMALAANCHILVAGDAARFGLTEIRLGLWPFMVFHAVSAAVGERRTLELALTGRAFGNGEALEIGLAHEAAEEALPRAAEIADTVAAFSPTAIAEGLRFVHEARQLPPQAAVWMARRIRDQVLDSPDFHEGVLAFREKRRPAWPSLQARK